MIATKRTGTAATPAAAATSGTRTTTGTYPRRSTTTMLRLPVLRKTLGTNSVSAANEGKLVFAQVREDPRIEIEALAIRAGERAVVIGSGGCTALSLLATGATDVVAVDSNAAQNHLIELKMAAVTLFGDARALQFLGGASASPQMRRKSYRELRLLLTPNARRYWDRRRRSIERGVLGAGKSERFIRMLAWCVRRIVESPGRVERLLACESVEAQRALFAREWNTWRWRAFFAVLLNRWTMSRAFDPRFFAHVGRKNFAEHFRTMAEHALVELPVRNNYFLHHMLTGSYAVGEEDGVPPYLSEAGTEAIASGAGRFALVDGGVTEYLATRDDASVHAIALSNVCEWMDAAAIDALFGEIDRVAAPGARIVFRNFVGWTDLPPSATRLEVDGPLSERLSKCDRSLVQSRVVVCRAKQAV